MTEQERAYSSLLRYGHFLDEIALFQVSIQDDGDLSARPSRYLVNEARRRGMKVLLVITNLTSKQQFALMSYEEHWSDSPPGSVASLPRVNQVLDYAPTNIPSQKIMMGIPRD